MQQVTIPVRDGHVHTSLCHHATGTMEEFVQAGLQAGLKELIFLEHMEEGIIAPRTTWLSEKDFDSYFAEGGRLQKKYATEMKIGLGVECGVNPTCTKRLRERIAKRDWDSVGISCHFLLVPEISPHHINLLSRDEQYLQLARSAGTTSLLKRYFDNLIEAVTIFPATKICHLDAALRHHGKPLLEDSHFQQIETLFVEMKKADIALEVNTSGLDIRNEPFPSRFLLEIAATYNLRLEFGSDAHQPREVARHFATIKSWLP